MTSPQDPHSRRYANINGDLDDLLDRLAVSELCKGWPVYRDASEWKNFRSLFCEDAYVWTTWSSRQSIDGFIQKSKEGKANGDFIMHRECGTVVDLNPSTGRAVGKMKATITQRFTLRASSSSTSPSAPATTSIIEPVVFDVDCDCRFHFFCQAVPPPSGSGGRPVWRVKYVKLIYDKDKVVPVDGRTAPSFSRDVLDRFPEGYRYLGAAQSMLGHSVDPALPTCQGAEHTAQHANWLDFFQKMEHWLRGDQDVDLRDDGKMARAGKNGHANGHGHGNGNGAVSCYAGNGANGHEFAVNGNGHVSNGNGHGSGIGDSWYQNGYGH